MTRSPRNRPPTRIQRLVHFIQHHPASIILGFIVVLIGFFGWVTGIFSLPDLFSSFSVPRSTSTTTSISPTATLEVTLEPLVVGTGEIIYDEFHTGERVGFNFKLGTMAYRNAPIDINLDGCEAALYVLFCTIHAEGLDSVGKKSLDDITEKPGYQYNFLVDEGLEEGKAYILNSYGGHPAKFRITDLDISYDGEIAIKAILVIDYVYQPNDRDDFQGP